jgi:hypothetical protein
MWYVLGSIDSYNRIAHKTKPSILDIANLAIERLSHTMASNGKSHNEIWDDSLLVDSWNEALEEYKVLREIFTPSLDSS